MTNDEILLELISLLPEEEQKPFLPLTESLNVAQEREVGQIDFLSFVQSVWPAFIYGRHHALMAQNLRISLMENLDGLLLICLPAILSLSLPATYCQPGIFVNSLIERLSSVLTPQN